MTTPNRITDQDLHAFMDGELDSEARAEVEAWLGEHPEDTKKLGQWQTQATRLHELYDDVLREPVPPQIKDALARTAQPGGRPAWRRAAAALALLVVGLGAGWLVRGEFIQNDGENFIRQAVGAHMVFVGEKRHAVEVWANEEKHLVAWLSKRLKHPVKAPYLADAGFRLVGGRLLADQDAPAAQFMYEDPAGRRVTLYTRRTRGADNAAFHFQERDGVAAFYWVGGPLAFALMGEMKRAELLTLARMVSNQLQD
jgi:anti-sigma factor RsiW